MRCARWRPSRSSIKTRLAPISKPRAIVSERPASQFSPPQIVQRRQILRQICLVDRIHPAPAYPSYQLGYQDGAARGAAKTQQHVVRQLLSQLDASRVAELLGLDLAEVERIAAAQDNDATRKDQQTG